MAAGSWFGLPELGLSELLGGNTKSIGGTGASIYSVPDYRSKASLLTPYAQAGGAGGSVKGDSDSIVYNSYPSAPSATRDVGSTGYNLQEATNSQKEADERTRSSINDTYKSYTKELDRLAGYLPNWEREDTNQLIGNFDYAGQQLGVARDTAMNKLGISRSNVEQNTAKSINDLQQNLRNMMKATNMQLGAMGAGDSSASQVMAPYAYAKLGSQNRNQVLDQRNSQLSDIDMKELDVISVYDTEKIKLESFLQFYVLYKFNKNY